MSTNSNVIQQAQEAAHIVTSNIPPAASVGGGVTALAAGIFDWNFMIGLIGIGIGLIGALIQYKNYKLNETKLAFEAEASQRRDAREAEAHRHSMKLREQKSQVLDKIATAPKEFDLPDEFAAVRTAFIDTDIN